MISDEMLAQAAEKAAAILNESLPEPEECNHVFSVSFERKMRRIIQQANHPILHHILRAAAGIALILLLGMGSFLTIDVQAREQFLGWVSEQLGNFYHYYFAGAPDNDSSSTYRLGWVPENLQFADLFEIEGGETYIYHDENGGITQFTYSSNPQSMEILILFNDHTQEDVSIHELPGTLYISRDPEESHGLIWIDEETNTFFFLSSFASPENILKMAESI